jgi:hypothetical protein
MDPVHSKPLFTGSRQADERVQGGGVALQVLAMCQEDLDIQMLQKSKCKMRVCGELNVSLGSIQRAIGLIPQALAIICLELNYDYTNKSETATDFREQAAMSELSRQ